MYVCIHCECMYVCIEVCEFLVSLFLFFDLPHILQFVVQSQGQGLVLLLQHQLPLLLLLLAASSLPCGKPP